MRILVVGAGAVGGYFGGRLLEAKQDVTFLVRQRRAAELAGAGLIVRSRFGDVVVAQPPTILAENLHAAFDLVLLSCKAYDLEGAIESCASAVGAETAILPLLNGMKHLDLLEQRFGPDRVLGGQCVIGSTLKPDGQIVHLNDAHSLSFGERDGSSTARVRAIAAAFAGARFEARLSETILQEMWEKWVFIATGAGITCLIRATVGDIVAAGAIHLTNKLLDECAAIAAHLGFPPRAPSLERARATFTAAGSPLTASMFRDIELGARTEADHVIGDLLQRGAQESGSSPLLQVVYAHLKAYEARRAREAAVGKHSAISGQHSAHETAIGK